MRNLGESFNEEYIATYISQLKNTFDSLVSACDEVISNKPDINSCRDETTNEVVPIQLTYKISVYVKSLYDMLEKFNNDFLRSSNLSTLLKCRSDLIYVSLSDTDFDQKKEIWINKKKYVLDLLSSFVNYITKLNSSASEVLSDVSNDDLKLEVVDTWLSSQGYFKELAKSDYEKKHVNTPNATSSLQAICLEEDEADGKYQYLKISDGDFSNWLYDSLMLSGLVNGIASSDLTGLSASDTGFSIFMWTKHDYSMLKDSALFSIKEKGSESASLAINYDSTRVYGYTYNDESKKEHEVYKDSENTFKSKDFALFEMRFDPELDENDAVKRLGVEVKVHKYEDLSGEMVYTASDLVSANYFDNFSLDKSKGVEFLFGASSMKTAKGANNYFFNGSIRDILVFKGHLTSKEAESLYEMRNPAKIFFQEPRVCLKLV